MSAISLLIPLLQNTAMLLAMVVIFAVSRHFAFNKFPESRFRLPLQISTGLLLGLIGIAIMLTPAEYVEGILFETRTVLISLTGLFFGWIPLTITVVITSVFRYWYGGDAVITGVLVILSSGFMGVLWRHYALERLERLKASELFIFGVLVHVLMLLTMLTLPNDIQFTVIRDIMWPVLLVYPLATVLVGKLLAQFTNISDKQNAGEQIWHQANIDGITGLPNRSMFMDRLKLEISRRRRAATRLALLFLDLDHFKEVNDSFGHDMGDLLLQQVASRLRHCVRETDTVARLGGDEFIIMLNDLHDTQAVGLIAQKVVDVMAEPFELQGSKVYVSASVGITVCPDDSECPEVLLKNADQAMYKAKKAGRNRYYYFTAAMQEEVDTRIRLLNELRLALQEQQLRVYYQPIVELASGRIVMVETLVHWQHPERGLLGPESFMPVVWDSALMVPLGNMVVREALAALQQVQAISPELQVSVNKYPAQLSSTDDQCIKELRQSELAAGRLVVEITEGLLLDERPVVQEHLQDLLNAGIRIALANFGTGHASLSCLKKFPIAFLKIDHSFVCNLEAGTKDHALSAAVISMAHRLGIQVSAEGVETAQQCALLLASGCDMGKGGHFSRPLSLAELELLLKSGAALTGGHEYSSALPLQRASQS